MRYRRLRLAGGTYFFTVVTRDRRPIFAETWVVLLLDAVVAKVMSRQPFDTEAQVVLPDHIHAIWSLPEGDSDFPTRWMLIKTAFSREYAKRRPSSLGPRLGRRSAIWQGRYWEHAIRDERDFTAHADYIHYNPVRHGLVSDPSDWPHSTFHRYCEAGDYPAGWGSGSAVELPDGVGRE